MSDGADAVREWKKAIAEAHLALRASKNEFKRVEACVQRAFEISHKIKAPPRRDPWYVRLYDWITMNLTSID